MTSKAYSKIKKLIRSQGKLFVGSGLLTFIRLSAGLILLKIAAIIGGNSAVAIYGQAQNVVSMVNGILASGAGEGVVKMTAQNQENPSKIDLIKSSSVMLVILSSFVLILISSMFWAFFIDWASLGKLTWLQIIIYIFGGLLTSIGTLLISLANGFQLLGDVVKINIVSIFSSLIISGIIFYLNGDSVILIIPAIYFGLVGVFQAGILLKKIRFPTNTFGLIDYTTIKNLGGFMFMALGSFFMTPFALITIRGWLIQDFGADSAGDWESSRKLLELVTALFTAYFAMVLLPKLAKISDTKLLRLEILNNAAVLMALSFLALLILFILRDQAYYVVFSSDFSFSSDLMGSRAIGEFLRSLIWIFGFILVVKAKVKLYLLTGFVYMLALLFTSWLMIGAYGVIGANYAYILSNSLMLVVSILIFYYITSNSYNKPKL